MLRDATTTINPATLPRQSALATRRDNLRRALRCYVESVADPDGVESEALVAETLQTLYDDVIASGASTAAEYRAIRDKREHVGRLDPLAYLDAEIGRYRGLGTTLGDRMADALMGVFAEEQDRNAVDGNEWTPTGLVAGLELAARGGVR